MCLAHSRFRMQKIVTDTGDVRYFALTTGTLDILVDTGDVTVNTPTPRSVRIVTDTGDVEIRIGVDDDQNAGQYFQSN